MAKNYDTYILSGLNNKHLITFIVRDNEIYLPNDEAVVKQLSTGAKPDFDDEKMVILNDINLEEMEVQYLYTNEDDNYIYLHFNSGATFKVVYDEEAEEEEEEEEERVLINPKDYKLFVNGSQRKNELPADITMDSLGLALESDIINTEGTESTKTLGKDDRDSGSTTDSGSETDRDSATEGEDEYETESDYYSSDSDASTHYSVAESQGERTGGVAYATTSSKDYHGMYSLEGDKQYNDYLLGLLKKTSPKMHDDYLVDVARRLRALTRSALDNAITTSKNVDDNGFPSWMIPIVSVQLKNSDPRPTKTKGFKKAGEQFLSKNPVQLRFDGGSEYYDVLEAYTRPFEIDNSSKSSPGVDYTVRRPNRAPHYRLRHTVGFDEHGLEYDNNYSQSVYMHILPPKPTAADEDDDSKSTDNAVYNNLYKSRGSLLFTRISSQKMLSYAKIESRVKTNAERRPGTRTKEESVAKAAANFIKKKDGTILGLSDPRPVGDIDTSRVKITGFVVLPSLFTSDGNISTSCPKRISAADIASEPRPYTLSAFKNYIYNSKGKSRKSLVYCLNGNSLDDIRRELVPAVNDLKNDPRVRDIQFRNPDEFHKVAAVFDYSPKELTELSYPKFHISSRDRLQKPTFTSDYTTFKDYFVSKRRTIEYSRMRSDSSNLTEEDLKILGRGVTETGPQFLEQLNNKNPFRAYGVIIQNATRPSVDKADADAGIVLKQNIPNLVWKLFRNHHKQIITDMVGVYPEYIDLPAWDHNFANNVKIYGVYPFEYTHKDTPINRTAWLFSQPDSGLHYYNQFYSTQFTIPSIPDFPQVSGSGSGSITAHIGGRGHYTLTKDGDVQNHYCAGDMIIKYGEDIYVWYENKYIPRDEYVKMLLEKRKRTAIVIHKQLVDDINNSIFNGKKESQIRSAIGTTAKGKGIKTIKDTKLSGLEQKAQYLLMKFNKLMMNDNISSYKYKKVLDLLDRYTIMNTKNQYVLRDESGDTVNICCKHVYIHLKMLMKGSDTHFTSTGKNGVGKDEQGTIVCRFGCGEIFEEETDSLPFTAGKLDIGHGVIDSGPEAESYVGGGSFIAVLSHVLNHINKTADNVTTCKLSEFWSLENPTLDDGLNEINNKFNSKITKINNVIKSFKESASNNGGLHTDVESIVSNLSDSTDVIVNLEEALGPKYVDRLQHLFPFFQSDKKNKKLENIVNYILMVSNIALTKNDTESGRLNQIDKNINGMEVLRVISFTLALLDYICEIIAVYAIHVTDKSSSSINTEQLALNKIQELMDYETLQSFLIALASDNEISGAENTIYHHGERNIIADFNKTFRTLFLNASDDPHIDSPVIVSGTDELHNGHIVKMVGTSKRNWKFDIQLDNKTLITRQPFSAFKLSTGANAGIRLVDVDMKTKDLTAEISRNAAINMQKMQFDSIINGNVNGIVSALNYAIYKGSETKSKYDDTDQNTKYISEHMIKITRDYLRHKGYLSSTKLDDTNRSKKEFIYRWQHVPEIATDTNIPLQKLIDTRHNKLSTSCNHLASQYIVQDSEGVHVGGKYYQVQLEINKYHGDGDDNKFVTIWSLSNNVAKKLDLTLPNYTSFLQNELKMTTQKPINAEMCFFGNMVTPEGVLYDYSKIYPDTDVAPDDPQLSQLFAIEEDFKAGFIDYDRGYHESVYDITTKGVVRTFIGNFIEQEYSLVSFKTPAINIHVNLEIKHNKPIDTVLVESRGTVALTNQLKALKDLHTDRKARQFTNANIKKILNQTEDCFDTSETSTHDSESRNIVIKEIESIERITSTHTVNQCNDMIFSELDLVFTNEVMDICGLPNIEDKLTVKDESSSNPIINRVYSYEKQFQRIKDAYLSFLKMVSIMAEWADNRDSELVEPKQSEKIMILKKRGTFATGDSTGSASGTGDATDDPIDTVENYVTLFSKLNINRIIVDESGDPAEGNIPKIWDIKPKYKDLFNLTFDEIARITSEDSHVNIPTYMKYAFYAEIISWYNKLTGNHTTLSSANKNNLVNVFNASSLGDSSITAGDIEIGDDSESRVYLEFLREYMAHICRTHSIIDVSNRIYYEKLDERLENIANSKSKNKTTSTTEQNDIDMDIDGEEPKALGSDDSEANVLAEASVLGHDHGDGNIEDH